MPAPPDNLLDLLIPVISGEARSFADVCRRHGMQPSEVLRKLVDDGSIPAQPDAVHTEGPLARYERIRHAAHLALDAELNGARFRAVRTINELASPQHIDPEASPGRMRSLEMVRRACISLMRLHLPTCNMAPPRQAPPAPRSGTSDRKPTPPSPARPTDLQGNYIETLNQTLAKHQAQLRNSSIGVERFTSGGPRQEQLIPTARFMDEPKPTVSSTTRPQASGEAPSPSPPAPAPAPATKSGERPSRSARRKAIAELAAEGFPRPIIARAMRHWRKSDAQPATGGPTASGTPSLGCAQPPPPP